MNADALIFDFDGVLIESEFVDNRELAACLTRLGHATRYEDALEHFVGLSGANFIAAVERWIGGPLPAAFGAERAATHDRLLAEGIEAVAGAVAFIEALPPDLPRAIASSSSVDWIAGHLDHLGIRHHFGDRLFSGREHVERGKPAPDLYWHAARAMGVEIVRTVVIEDSVVGVTGAVASGAQVIGLCAGRHCSADHRARLLAAGAHRVAGSFDEAAELLADRS
jgi:HAD superfamily hydrolase (TIGR01509 family)